MAKNAASRLILAVVTLAALTAVFLFANPARAAGEGIYFSEIMWRGSSVSPADEWVELYNSSGEATPLSGWSIFDEVKGETIAQIGTGEVAIDSNSFFVIAHSTESDRIFKKGELFLESVLNIPPDFVGLKYQSLSNTKFQISLRNPRGEVVDKVGDGEEPFYGEYKGKVASMQRVNSGRSGDEKDAWRPSMERKNLDDDINDYATPKDHGKTIISLDLEQNKIKLKERVGLHFDYSIFDPLGELKTVRVGLEKDGQVISESATDFGAEDFSFRDLNVCPRVVIYFYDRQDNLWAQKSFNLICYQLSTQIKFYEILPHPKNKDWNGDGKLDTSDEWIELVNFGAEPVNLAGWQIRDLSGKTYELSSHEIAPEGFLVFPKSQTGLSLNDSGEKLWLFDPEGQQMDLVEVGSSSTKYDYSWAKWGDNWWWTTTPTPGAINQIIQPGKLVQTDLDQADESEGKNVSISGEIKEIERTSLIIGDSTCQLEIRLSGDCPDLKVGDQVTISGLTHRAYLSALAVLSKSSQQTVASDEQSVLEDQGTIVERTIKRKSKTRFKVAARNLRPLTLGEEIRRSRYFNYRRLLLSYLGALGFLMVILIYDFACRK